MPHHVFFCCGVLVEVVFCTWIPTDIGVVEPESVYASDDAYATEEVATF
jgi:hypothetical protein